MPKAPRRSRTTTHDPSAPPLPSNPSKRAFVAQENVVEKVEIGSLAGLSGDAILKQISNPTASHPPTKAAHKRARHDQFLAQIDATKSSRYAPYPMSKSAIRRAKKKAKETIPSLGDLGDVLDELDDGQEVGLEVGQGKKPAMKATQQTTMIGEGKASTLTKKQRARALDAERLRHTAVLADPNFRANPFAAIRHHAVGTIVPAQPPAPSQEGEMETG